MRKILSARDQVEMLSPWRLASTPGKIYRGIRLTNLPDELRSEIHRLQQPPMETHEFGQHLKIGPMLLDHLHNTPWKPFTQTPDHLAYTGLGRHWSRRKEFAQMAASNQIGPGMSVVIEADDPGEQHYDPDLPMTGKRPDGTGWEDEQEATLLPNTPLNITSIRLPGKLFDEVLDDPYYHNMEQEYGHPYPGGPRPGVGGIAQDPFAKKRQARTASGFDPMAVTNRLKGEFSDWFDALPQHRLDELRNIEMHPFMDHHENNPVSHWPTVERFLKDRYPAAHRGFMTGREDASMWLDDPNNEYEDPMLEGDDEFGSLPPPEPYSSADHEKLGYDPQEVAAGMVLLHNRAHSGRQDSYLNTDKKRLVDIYNKRQQMQRQYEQRTGATYWHITDHPDFKPDPDYSPELNTTMGGEMKPGLFLTRNPSHWMQGYGYWRPYVSEIEAPDDIGEGSHLSPERYVPAEQYHRMHVKRTIPIDAYSREHYNEPGWVENSFGYDFQSGSPLDSAPGGYHKRNWDGRYHYPGTAMDQPEEWRKSYEQRVRDYQQRTPGIIARTAASDLDDILELLGQPGRADYTRPSPREQHEPIPGVPLGWERYVTELSGQEPGEAHLHLPVHVLDHYKEYDRDPHSEQAQALSHMLNTEGIRNPVHISTDGTHALMYEGNNRLAVAKQLGITHLPVRVTYEKPGRVIRNEGTPVPLEKTLGSWVAANKHHLKPFFEGG